MSKAKQFWRLASSVIGAVLLCWTASGSVAGGQSPTGDFQTPDPGKLHNGNVSEQDSTTLPEHAVWQFGEHDHSPDANGIYRLQYSPDGSLLAVRNRENEVAIYDVLQRKRLCSVDGHDDNKVTTIDFSPDSKFFVTAAGSNENVKIWNSQTGKLESEITTDASAAYFNNSGDVISVLGESDVESYSWPGVQLLSQSKWKSNNEARTAMSRDGRLVVVLRTVKPNIFQMQVLNLDAKSKIELDGPMNLPSTVVISPNRLWMAAAFRRNDRIQLWDLRDPHQKKYILANHDETIQSLSFSPDSRFLISSSWDEKVVAWDLLTRQAIGEFKGHSEHVNATAFSPSGLTFASGASGVTDCSTIVWNLGDLLLGPVTDDDRDLENIWKGLGSNTLDTAFTASSALISAGDDLMDRLLERINESIPERSLGVVESAISLLGHPEYAVRQQATEQLLKVRSQVAPRLQTAIENAESPEVRYRLSMILRKKITRPKRPIEERRRWHRMIFSLEQINSEQSQMLLETIGDGHQDFDIGQDARDSFRRNELRGRRGL